MSLRGNRAGVILVLGTTQTLAWASSYYLPAILADRIAADIGISSTWFFAAFSSSLVISALIGPRVGRILPCVRLHRSVCRAESWMIEGIEHRWRARGLDSR